jgi:hypothetical protein
MPDKPKPQPQEIPISDMADAHRRREANLAHIEEHAAFAPKAARDVAAFIRTQGVKQKHRFEWPETCSRIAEWAKRATDLGRLQAVVAEWRGAQVDVFATGAPVLAAKEKLFEAEQRFKDALVCEKQREEWDRLLPKYEECGLVPTCSTEPAWALIALAEMEAATKATEALTEATKAHTEAHTVLAEAKAKLAALCAELTAYYGLEGCDPLVLRLALVLAADREYMAAHAKMARIRDEAFVLGVALPDISGWRATL